MINYERLTGALWGSVSPLRTSPKDTAFRGEIAHVQLREALRLLTASMKHRGEKQTGEIVTRERE